MSDELNNLQEMGAQKIYEDTHIPVEHVQAILHGSFDGLTKVQLLGFISILEREYHMDLDDLKKKAHEHFNVLTENDVENITDDAIFIAPTKNKNTPLTYILIAIAIFMMVAYFSLDSSQEDENITVVATENPIIEDVKKSIVIEDNNETNDTIETLQVEEDVNVSQMPAPKVLPVVVEEKELPESFKIVSDTAQVWIGYIELETNKKYQKTFEGELDLDPKKNWLLVLGHGYIDFIIGNEIKKFDGKKDVRFLYKDGEIKPISKDEFIELNRGSSW